LCNRPVGTISACDARDIQVNHIKRREPQAGSESIAFSGSHVLAVSRAHLHPVPGINLGTQTCKLTLIITGETTRLSQVDIERGCDEAVVP
jgi:hypothetical protein